MLNPIAISNSVSSAKANPGLLMPKNRKDHNTLKNSCPRNAAIGIRISWSFLFLVTSHAEKAIAVKRPVQMALIEAPEGVHAGFRSSFSYHP